MNINFSQLLAASGSEVNGMTPILQFLLVLSLILFAAKALGYLSTRLGQPAVLGELLAGIILGPSLINIYALGFIPPGDKIEVEDTIKKLAELGVIFLMFIAGLEINLKDMLRVGKVAVFSGTSGVIFPILLGFLLALPFGYSGEKALFIGILLAATSVSISAQTLMELGMLKRREGIALLGAAVLDDVLVVLVLSLYVALTGSGGGIGDIALVLAKMVAFFVIAVGLGIKILPWVLAKIKKLPISEGLIAGTIIIVLLTAWVAEYLGGVAMIVGAFLVGAMAGQTRYKHELEEKFHTIIYSFFVPIFFVSIGLIVNVTAIPGETWFFALALSLVAILSKILGCGLGARVAGFNNLSSLRLGLGMVSRGEVGLIVATVGITQAIITQEVYTAVVVMVLVTTIFTPFALKIAFKGEKKAGAPSIKPEQEAGSVILDRNN